VALLIVEQQIFERVSRLYEQGATASRIGEYARRWWRWIKSGVSRVEKEMVGDVGSGVRIGREIARLDDLVSSIKLGAYKGAIAPSFSNSINHVHILANLYFVGPTTAVIL
jgi:hypothetical protein